VFSEIASGAMRDLNIASKEPDYDSASMLPLDQMIGSSHRKNADPMASIDPGVDYDAALSGKATPDFRGASLRHALDIARQLRVNIEVKGQGYVIAQDPAPGTTLPRSAISLTLAPAGTSAGEDMGGMRRLRPEGGAQRHGAAVPEAERSGVEGKYKDRG
jgi:hypothetical protein